MKKILEIQFAHIARYRAVYENTMSPKKPCLKVISFVPNLLESSTRSVRSICINFSRNRVKLCVFVHHSESAVHAVNNDSTALEKLVDVVVREATAINSDVKEECVREGIERIGLSWEVIENQRKDVIVGKLRVIAELDENQCHELFKKLDRAVPIAPEMDRRNRILLMKRIFYRQWIMKCMYSAFNAFECFCGEFYRFGGDFNSESSGCRRARGPEQHQKRHWDDDQRCVQCTESNFCAEMLLRGTPKTLYTESPFQ